MEFSTPNPSSLPAKDWLAQCHKMSEDNTRKCVEASYGNFAPLSARLVEARTAALVPTHML